MTETAGSMSVLLKPFDKVAGRSGSTGRFYLADCLEVFRQLPPHSVDVIVTSPPYNLGIEYGQYQDTLSRPEYLEWTNTWIAAAARVLSPAGSLFLNVGATKRSVDRARRRAGGTLAPASSEHRSLDQVDRDRPPISSHSGRADPGSRRRPLQTDQQRPLPERLPGIHLPLHAAGGDPAQSAGAGRFVSGPVECRTVARRGGGRALSRQHLVHPLQNDPAARPQSASPGDVPFTAA